MHKGAEWEETGGTEELIRKNEGCFIEERGWPSIPAKVRLVQCGMRVQQGGDKVADRLPPRREEYFKATINEAAAKGAVDNVGSTIQYKRNPSDPAKPIRLVVDPESDTRLSLVTSIQRLPCR